LDDGCVSCELQVELDLANGVGLRGILDLVKASREGPPQKGRQMKIVRVVGTATATVKAMGLTGHKLLVVNIEDGAGNVLERSIVATDTVGAGIGDLCIMAQGSAARLPQDCAGLPVDATLIAIVDTVAFK